MSVGLLAHDNNCLLYQTTVSISEDLTWFHYQTPLAFRSILHKLLPILHQIPAFKLTPAFALHLNALRFLFAFLDPKCFNFKSGKKRFPKYNNFISIIPLMLWPLLRQTLRCRLKNSISSSVWPLLRQTLIWRLKNSVSSSVWPLLRQTLRWRLKNSVSSSLVKGDRHSSSVCTEMFLEDSVVKRSDENE